MGEGALDAFAADATGALENFRAAARRSGLEFAAELGDRRAADVADLALGTLRSLVEEQRGQQAASKTKAAAKVWRPHAAISFSVLQLNSC
jgi:hypothetical protein